MCENWIIKCTNTLLFYLLTLIYLYSKHLLLVIHTRTQLIIVVVEIQLLHHQL